MSDTADAAMIAIAKALREPWPARLLIWLGLRPPKAMPIENRIALRTIRRHMTGHPVDHDDLESALHTVVLRVQPALRPSAWQVLLSDEYDFPAILDAGEASEALSRIECGQVEDCLIHLERALPADFARIAERLAHHFRSRP